VAELPGIARARVRVRLEEIRRLLALGALARERWERAFGGDEVTFAFGSARLTFSPRWDVSRVLVDATHSEWGLELDLPLWRTAAP
jgi:hypothetical protein